REDMRLVGSDTEPRPGLKEEFVDLDVAGERACMQRGGIGELGIAAKDAPGKRGDKTSLELIPAARLLQRQRGEDAQANRGVAGRARKQRVGDVIGLAQAER